MGSSRRRFLQGAASAAAGVVLTQALEPAALLAGVSDVGLAPWLTGRRMAASPATDYRAYRSRPVTDPGRSTWVQIDLGSRIPLEAVELYPACQRPHPGIDGFYGGEGFPLRFRIEVSDEAEFRHPRTIADLTDADFPDVQNHITRYPATAITARYVRLTATKLRPVKMDGPHGVQDSSEFSLMIAKIGVLAGGRDVAVGCRATADAQYGNRAELGQLTRAARADGEQVRWDHPENVTPAESWRPVALRVRIPRSGVTMEEGLFRTAMEKNIRYLLDSYTTDQLLRQFRERAGLIRGYKATGDAVFWEEDLAGSNAGRFLMGAGNTLRWIHDPELQRRLDAVVDGIDACRQADGYMMAYPPETIFYSERAAYTRAWVTHGLLDAAYAGNRKALPLLRGYYDWYNRQEQILPELWRGVTQGGQGMVANTRVARSSMGRPADVQVIQRYFEESGFLRGAAARDEKQIWQYPYDRPHCYLLTNLEAYMDLYLATGEGRYHDAVLGGWELYHEHWQQPGGSISIIEFLVDPPDSNSLHQELGELCGSSFWVFLSQRLHCIEPDEERYMAEIEKTIYNVGIANQDGTYGLRYHTHLEGTKEKGTRHNSCCEGQGTRLLGSLPEHIYSLAEDGVYLNLYAPSSIAWQQQGQKLRLTQKTRFPFDNRVECIMEVEAPTRSTLRVRVPSWAAEPLEIFVNGNRAAGGEPGSYVPIDRRWEDGDRVVFALPMTFRTKVYRGVDQIAGAERFSIEYGPLLYAAAGAAQVELAGYETAEAVAEALAPVAGEPLHYRLESHPQLTWMPYWQVDRQEFSCFPGLRRQRV